MEIRPLIFIANNLSVLYMTGTFELNHSHKKRKDSVEMRTVYIVISFVS